MNALRTAFSGQFNIVVDNQGDSVTTAQCGERTRLLQAAFDDAIFVFVLRHPLAVAYSTAGRGRPGVPAQQVGP